MSLGIFTSNFNLLEHLMHIFNMNQPVISCFWYRGEQKKQVYVQKIVTGPFHFLSF